jgi:hypothetical protein
MAHKFAEIAFTPVVRAIQVEEGSRTGYARMDEGDDYPAQIERGFIIEVEGFDWNCPQHITPGSVNWAFKQP